VSAWAYFEIIKELGDYKFVSFKGQGLQVKPFADK